MKTHAQLLKNFIQDFNLENEDESVCFTANIEFRTDSLFKKMDSEIHLVTFQQSGLSVLYLLDPDIAKQKIPDVIPYDDENFFYNKNRFLIVKGLSPDHGAYSLIIYPVERKCYSKTTAELRMKALN